MLSLKTTVLALVIQLTFYHVARSQEARNLDFAEACTSTATGLCSWEQSWGARGSVSAAELSGKPALHIRGEKENSVGFTEQSIHLSEATSPQIITVSASIRSSGVVGKGAGLNVGLYDKSDKLIATKDMGGFYSLDWIRGDTQQRTHSISIVRPPEAVKVKIGAILYGRGDVYFQNYRVQIEPIATRKPSRLASSLIGSVAAIIHKHSLVARSIDLAQITEAARKIAGPARQYRDCYLAVEYMLEALRPAGDEHSFFMKPAEFANWQKNGSQVSRIISPSVSRVDDYGYILVPAFHSGNPRQMLDYADKLQSGIKTVYASGIRGWIVDLRQNTGGNMAPMIAGLGPLFSDRELGALLDVNGHPNHWYYDKGRYYWDNDRGWRVSAPVELTRRLPIAVLISGQTGSSGEAVVVSFIGNANTRLFGSPTWGLTTGNDSYPLRDGSRLFLASTTMSDRRGKVYTGPVQPDVVIGQDQDPGAVLAAAVAWIRTP